MQLVSFDPLRTWDIPGTRPVKAARWQEDLDKIRAADWVLFPEYWQVNFLTYGLKAHVFPSFSSYHVGHNKVDIRLSAGTKSGSVNIAALTGFLCARDKVDDRIEGEVVNFFTFDRQT